MIVRGIGTHAQTVAMKIHLSFAQIVITGTEKNIKHYDTSNNNRFSSNYDAATFCRN